MKAVQIENYGSIDELKIVEIDTPVPVEGQVQVEVHASSVNPIETIVRTGRMQADSLSLPITLGGDFAGVITAVGSGVTDFAVGDKIYGQASVLAGNSGAFAEYAVAVVAQVGKMPQEATFEEAASLPLVGVSALQALEEHINIQKGQKLFIHGGAGGIGSIAIQVAKQGGVGG